MTVVKVGDKPVRWGFMVRDALDCPEEKKIHFSDRVTLYSRK